VALKLSWAVITPVVLLAACGVLSPHMETPRLSLVDAQLLKGDLFEQRIKVRMRVQNPNNRELEVKGISYAIDVAGQEFGTGMTANSFTVPRMGEAEFDMLVTANMAGILVRLLGSDGNSGAAKDALDYRIHGKVSLASGFLRSIPFDEKGSLKLHK
jgi:LEA14-like dessication related protein